MDMSSYVRYAVLNDEEAALKLRLKEIAQEKKLLGEALLDEMADNGMAKMTLKVGVDEDGLPVRKTLYIQRQLWAGHQGDKQALMESLKLAGYEDLVAETVNTNTLSALVRELDPDNNRSPEDIINMLPPELHSTIKVTEKIELRSRKA